jgi:O-antigen/teichoic acid export membrane protein
MTARVLKGSVWSLIGQIAPMTVSLLTTPFIIRMLGAEAFGVYVLAGLIPAYLLFADLGMGLASTKFGSEKYAAGDASGEARVVWTASAIAAAASLPIAVLIVVLADQLAEWLNVPESIRPQAAVAFRFAAVSFVFALLGNIVNTPQLARLRMDLNTLVSSLTRIAGLIAAPLIIYFGGGIAGAVFGLMAASVLAFAGHFSVSSRLNAHLIKPQIDRGSVNTLVKFGAGLALSSIAAVLLTNLEKLILTTQTSVEQLAYYSVAFTLSNAATLFGLSMSQSIIPAFSQLLAPERSGQLKALYSRVLKVSVFGLLPLIAVLFVIARTFFTVWAGPDFGRESTVPFYLLLCGLVFNLNAFVPSALILSSGRSDLFAKFYWIELAPYIIATAVLTSLYGAVGAALAWSARTIIDAFLFFWFARRVRGVETKLDLTRVLAGVGLLAPPIASTLVFADRGLWLSGPLLVISMIIYALFVWKYVFVDEERAWVMMYLKRSSGLDTV